METKYIKTKADAQNAIQAMAVMNRAEPEKLLRVRIDYFDEQSRIQQEKYHAMLGDIAKQAIHLNQVLDEDSWKRLCVKQFADDCIEQNIDRLADYWKRNSFKLMPSLDGKSLVTLGNQTRDFPKYVSSGFIEWLYSFGVDNKIVWSEPKYEQERERFAA